VSAEAKKNLVARHLREPIEQDERRTAPPPALWPNAYRDRCASAGAHSFPRFAGNVPPVMRTSRHRGGG
jgi:hypothetical protein